MEVYISSVRFWSTSSHSVVTTEEGVHLMQSDAQLKSQAVPKVIFLDKDLCDGSLI